MNAIELLLGRVSRPVLESPGPTKEQLDIMFSAALRAPDHARLRPWRFLTVTGDARHVLGELLAKILREGQPDISEDALNRCRGLPLRAPTLVLAICVTQDHAKVPVLEQQLSLGAAVQNILLAAHAQTVGAVWRTGNICYHPSLAKGLGLSENEQLLGFIYMGTPAGSRKKIEEVAVSDFVTEWGQ
ncbi:nitroreductase [Endozoicomonas sp. (ex Bugula neritina AB1)]|nr:nitroreductase [Endozoicomonas sp. (ex Bugula neritina AB1)]